MKCIYIFTTITALIINAPSYSMENTSPVIDLTDIINIQTPITNPTHITFVNNNVITVAGRNGFAFVNLTSPECKHLQQENKIDDLAANSSKTKIATSCKGLLTAYDTTKQEKTWEYNTQTNCFAPITFDSQNKDQLITHVTPQNVLLLQNGNITEQYTTYRRNTTILPTPIVCHPQRTSIIYISQASNQFDTASIVSAFHTRPTIDDDPYKHELLREVNLDMCGGCMFNNFTLSADHACFASFNKEQLYLRNLQTRKLWLFQTPYIGIGAIFHPNNKFLITLSYIKGKPYQLQYWDFDALVSVKRTGGRIPDMPEPFASHTLKDYFPSEAQPCSGKPLAISPDSKFIAIALFPNICCMVRIPFETIAKKLYAAGAAEKCISTLFLLKNYKTDDDGFLPFDIAQLIMYYLLEAQRYESQLD